MNNKFIPVISVFMTISLIVFVALQSYWLKEYYSALNQDFSNKVHKVMENTTTDLVQLENNRFWNQYKNFDQNVIADYKQPTSTIIQTVEDSATKRQITSYKSIVSEKEIPVSNKGDSFKVTQMYTDESALQIKKNENTPEILTSELDQSIGNGEFALREFATLRAKGLPIEKRVKKSQIDSILRKELRLQGIDTKFGFGILDKNSKLTSINNDVYSDQQSEKIFSYPLFVDSQSKTTQYSLSLVFPRKDYSLAKNNLPMLLGTFMSLLTILGIYIISINYMMRQKKIADVKTDFINNMSHEFKTPLATISVATDSLANDKIANNPEKVRYYSGLIKQENLRMKKQVENVLNMSKLERNEVKLFLKETDVRKLINEISERFSLIVNQRNGTLTRELKAEQHHFKIDEFHFANMLTNLLDNANKYSPESPEITVRTRNEGLFYVIEIIDNGIGMEHENKKKIFEKFFREETGNVHNVKGQGLGLSYVKKIVELHKGQIFVESNKGKGSTFIVKFPIQ